MYPPKHLKSAVSSVSLPLPTSWCSPYGLLIRVSDGKWGSVYNDLVTMIGVKVPRKEVVDTSQLFLFLLSSKNRELKIYSSELWHLTGNNQLWLQVYQNLISNYSKTWWYYYKNLEVFRIGIIILPTKTELSHRWD